MTRYAVGLGSNQGDRLDHLVLAVEDIRTIGTVTAVSGLYETEPVGGPEQDPFLNAVVVVETDLPPRGMLERLQDTELEHGRERKVRWGPRTLDLDIIASDGESHKDDRLEIPHPRAAERAFVLRPLTDVWPQAPVGDRVSAIEALSGADTAGVDLLSIDWLPPVARWPGRVLVTAQFLLFIVAALALAGDGRLPEGEVTVLGVTGAIIAIAGMIMAFVSSRRLGPAMTAHPTPKKDARLVLTGPYRYVRHPIYGGVTLVLAGTAMFLDSLWGGLVTLALGVFFWFKAGYEERQLRMRFAGYRAYCGVVHRRLIPFLV